jgi:hypothetical protein
MYVSFEPQNDLERSADAVTHRQRIAVASVPGAPQKKR